MTCCLFGTKPLPPVLASMVYHLKMQWSLLHDDIIKWKYFPRYWSFVRGIHRSPVNSLHKGQRRGALMFSLISAWINGWQNKRETGDLRRHHHAHYDVIVMSLSSGIYASVNWNIIVSGNDLLSFWYQAITSCIGINGVSSQDAVKFTPWWHHQMETFSTLLALCAGNSAATGEFPPQRPVTWSFDVFFDLRLNKWLTKQSWDWWFETPSRPLWCDCNVIELWYICTGKLDHHSFR